MRILFVAMPESVHTARWIDQLAGPAWDVHLFPAYEAEPHEDLRDVTFHSFSRARRPGGNAHVRRTGPYPLRRGATLARMAAERALPRRLSPAARLAALIKRLKPDVIHTLQIQVGGYPTLAAKEALGGPFPPWFVSCWGSDLYFFGRLKSHAEKTRAVLSACDYFTADCERDIQLAREFGFRGDTFPALPVAGGFDVERALALRPPGPASARRSVTLKGYQHWAGRALVGLRAIELCADVMRGYRVALYSVSPDVEAAAELMSQRTGIPVDVFPHISHEDSLRMHAAARVSLGVSISDGLPLTTMEAALMGSFPIQSDTSCVGERLRDGETTLLVPAEDASAVAAALRRALTDDALVDRAADLNLRYISEKLTRQAVAPQVVAMYERIFADTSAARAAAGGVP